MVVRTVTFRFIVGHPRQASQALEICFAHCKGKLDANGNLLKKLVFEVRVPTKIHEKSGNHDDSKMLKARKPFYFSDL